MRGFKYTLAAVLCSTALTPSFAQESDKDWLTRMLEENLSGAGRAVEITGFTGALSSRATITQMTIADDEGVWLTLDDVVLDWSRTALLSGQVIVNELSAATITVARLPASGEEDALSPEAEAFTFALPELPVSVDIGTLRADKIALGETILGQALEGTLLAKVHLSGGEGEASLTLDRTDDGPEGQITLAGSYANATQDLTLDLTAKEGANGIVAQALELPGAPAAELSLKGTGKINDFAADFRLASDEEERLSGPITVKTDEAGATLFSADLGGNPAPLFLPEYAGFLGDDLELTVKGQRAPDGRLQLDDMALAAEALRLKGQIVLAADGLPERIDLAGDIANQDGSPVLLPISGPIETRIDRADLALTFDAAQGSDWSLDLDMLGLDRADLKLAQAAIKGAGQIDRIEGKRGVDGKVDFFVNGLSELPPEVLAASGENLSGSTRFAWREGTGILNLPEISLSGADYGLNGALALEGFDDGFKTRGQAQIEAQNLSRFSQIAGLPLVGQAQVQISGEYTPLSGAFDADLDVKGQGIQIGQVEVDRLLAGESRITAALMRDEQGIALEALNATAASLQLAASGRLATAANTLSGTLDWDNISDLGGPYSGALKANFGFVGTPENGTATLEGTGNGLRIGQSEVDRLIAGEAKVSGQIDLVDGVVRLQSANIETAEINAAAKGAGYDGSLDISGALRNLGLLVPEFPGRVELAGRLTPSGAGYETNLTLKGPADINAQLRGYLAADGPNLQITGSGNAAAANAFIDPITLIGALGYDLRLTGWTPADASGQLRLRNARVAVPAQGLALENVEVTADLAGGNAQVNLRGRASNGGDISVNGGVNLNAPYSAALNLQALQLKLRDPQLYETTLDARLALNGPLLSNALLAGRVTLGVTELRVPSTGFASAADLEAVRHVNDKPDVRATRNRAGIGAEAGSAGANAGAGGPNWGLDLVIEAPSRVFIRGRGLDAELGGEVRVGGTLQNIVPSGGLDLVRGRLDILGQRLDLSSASLVLEGDFIPFLNIAASNQTGDVTSIVSIQGPADDPVVSFTSDPELPQEEVLAWLLFGRSLDTISAFQAVQLANAVATLAGKGGEGIVGKLRKGFGFDDLDVNTAEDGSTSVKAGKYIGENIYTEVGVDQDGNSRINLNLDLPKGVTLKGRVDSTGESGIGIFKEKDY